MGLSRLYQYLAGNTASGAEVRTELDQIYNNAGGSLTSPRTAALDMAGFDISNTDEIEFDNASADPTAGTTPSIRNNAGTLKVRVQDNRTNTTARPLGVIADTSGSAAASIGVGMLFEAESADEAPSSFGALDFVASDVTAGSEDTHFNVLLRVAGAALTQVYRFVATAANKAIFTHANAADRTYTLPDATGTVALTTSQLAPTLEDARTNSVARPLTVVATTSDTPAAGIGAGLLVRAESADENPSDFGALDFVATDVASGSEDTYACLKLRVAGRALDDKYQFQSTAGDGFTAIVTHAVTADRTYTLPDASGTVAMLPGSWSDVSASRSLGTSYQNTGTTERRVHVVITFAADAQTQVETLVGTTDPPTTSFGVWGTSGAIGNSAVRIPQTIIVPVNQFYRINTSAGSPSIIEWLELN